MCQCSFRVNGELKRAGLFLSHACFEGKIVCIFCIVQTTDLHVKNSRDII